MDCKFYMSNALEKLAIDFTMQDERTADYIRINMFCSWFNEVKNTNNKPILVFDGADYNSRFIKAFTIGLLSDKINLYKDVTIISEEDEGLIDCIKEYTGDYTFSEWLDKNQEKDNIFLPPLEPQKALDFLRKYLLGEDWYIPAPVSNLQANTAIVHEILSKYSQQYKKETNTEISFLEKVKNFFKKKGTILFGN